MSNQIIWWMATAPRWELLVASISAVLLLVGSRLVLTIPLHKMFRLHR